MTTENQQTDEWKKELLERMEEILKEKVRRNLREEGFNWIDVLDKYPKIKEGINWIYPQKKEIKGDEK